MNELVIKETLTALPHVARLPGRQVTFSHDSDADVLYVSFERPQKATDSTLTDDDIIVRTRGRKVVGLTILNASRFMG